MPQDLKILLQGIRRSSFSHLCDHLQPEQFGWKPGFGCAEPSLALTGVLQQARRLQHKVWILYIDLAGFFPSINRKVAARCEDHAGLPKQVADIMRQVYGNEDDLAATVKCQYETAAGLGLPFANHVGRLMGCPISPDSAKVLLDSIISAIKASVKGVQLWPFKGAEVVQAAYADDWVGMFDDEEQLRKAWDMWRAWAEMVGAQLGVKKSLKTVVTGVRWQNGRAITPEDPHLQLAGSACVPFIAAGDLYKHLGVPRSCDADGRSSWLGGGGVAGVKSKLMTGIRRLRRLNGKDVSKEEFMTVSNVLLGGLAGFYLQTAVASEDELEEVERSWRCAFARFAGDCRGTPIGEFYGPSRAWSVGRTHLKCIASAALYAAIEKAMADAVPSPSREVTRSMVALALFSAGCRSDPNRWDWGHLRAMLEGECRGRAPRYLGSAWMLACLNVEEGREPESCRKALAEAKRASTWGRWRGLGMNSQAGFNPLAAHKEVFRTSSALLFEPTSTGGLGLTPNSTLLSLGIAELRDMCTHAFRGDSGKGRWLMDKRNACFRLHLSPANDKWWSAWRTVVLEAESVGVQPCIPRPSVRASAFFMRYQLSSVHCEDPDCRARTVAALSKAREARNDSVPADVWERRLRKGFLGTTELESPALGQRFKSGDGRDAAAVGFRLDGEAEEFFLQTGRLDVSVEPIARQQGWEHRAQELQRRVRFQMDDGWPLVQGLRNGAEYEAVMESLPPALQLEVRARIELGEDAITVARGHGEKLKGVRVARDVQERNWLRRCTLQARLDFTHAFATDSSRNRAYDEAGKLLVDDFGWPIERTAAAAFSHTGVWFGGCFEDHMPSDNYLGEMMAVIVALQSVPPGSRVLIILDATSPLKAWLRFRRKSQRGRCYFYGASLLDRLNDLIDIQELVFFEWQSSHCGDPANERADILADQFRSGGGGDVLWEPESADMFSMWPSRPTGPLFSWAKSALQLSMCRQLRSREGNFLFQQDDDWELGTLEGEDWDVAEGMRREVVAAGDPGHKVGTEIRRAMGTSCPLDECEGGGSSWHHYVFACRHPQLQEARVEWRRNFFHWHRVFDATMLHPQVRALGRLVDGAQRRQEDAPDGGDVREARRFLCGFVEKSARGTARGEGEAVAAIKEMVMAGLRILGVAQELEEEFRSEVEGAVRDRRSVKAAFAQWQSGYLLGGPLRAAAFRQVGLARTLAAKVASYRLGEGTISSVEAVQFMRDVWELLGKAQKDISRRIQRAGAEAMSWWAVKALWWRRMRRSRAFGSGPRPIAWEVELEGALSLIRHAAPEGWEATVSLDDQECAWRGQRGAEGGGFTVRFRVTGAKGIHIGAVRTWLRLGGIPGLRKLRRGRRSTERELLRARRRRETEEAAAQLARFFAVGSCSGAPAPRYQVEEKITLELGRRQKRPRQDKIWEKGLRADKRGRWAVDNVILVREMLHIGWQALVSWVGPYEDCWVKFSDLSREARRDAEAMRWEREEVGEERWWRGWSQALSQDKVEPPSQRVGPRTSGRIAAKEKLATAIVPFISALQKEGRSGRRRAGVMHAVKRVWGRYRRGVEEWVHVEWEEPAEGDPETVPLSWLTDDLQLVACGLCLMDVV